MQKSKIIDALKERLDMLEKWRQAESKEVDKDKHNQKVDEDVCPECGGDLLFVEKGIVFCPACDQYFEEEE